MLRSWPSTQPVLAACAQSASVQFAQQPDHEKSEQPKEPWDAYGLSHLSPSALPTELQALAFSLHSQSGSLEIECVSQMTAELTPTARGFLLPAAPCRAAI